MVYYYVQIGHEGNGFPGAAMGFSTSPAKITGEDVNQNKMIEIPDNNPTLLGYRYLGDDTPEVVVLGSDYLSYFEAPPAAGCYWDGKEWVCPE